eukprot:4146304-Prymnesium_polylepis.1
MKVPNPSRLVTPGSPDTFDGKELGELPGPRRWARAVRLLRLRYRGGEKQKGPQGSGTKAPK